MVTNGTLVAITLINPYLIYCINNIIHKIPYYYYYYFRYVVLSYKELPCNADIIYESRSRLYNLRVHTVPYKFSHFLKDNNYLTRRAQQKNKNKYLKKQKQDNNNNKTFQVCFVVVEFRRFLPNEGTSQLQAETVF